MEGRHHTLAGQLRHLQRTVRSIVAVLDSAGIPPAPTVVERVKMLASMRQNAPAPIRLGKRRP